MENKVYQDNEDFRELIRKIIRAILEILLLSPFFSKIMFRRATNKLNDLEYQERLVNQITEKLKVDGDIQ